MAKSRKPTKNNTTATPCSASDDGGGNEHFTAYSSHSSTLRTWLVAYGVGGPVLILSQYKIWAILAKSGSLRLIAVLFLVGVTLQVLLAAVNKSVMWSCYYGEVVPKYKKTWRYRVAGWLSEQYLIDLSCDLASMAVFGLATYFCFTSLAV